MSGETRELIDGMKAQHYDRRGQRLAAVCEILLEQHPERECDWKHLFRGPCDRQVVERYWCQPCRDRALLERCDRAAGDGE